MQTPSQNNAEKKSQVQDYFSRTAENYVTSTTHRAGPDLARLIEIGEWDKQQQVLDVATGGGHTALAIAPLVAQVTVSDLTPRMLEKARAFILSQGVSNAVFVQADAEQLPFADGSFDPSHGRSCTREEWHAFFAQAGLGVEYEETFRKTHNYDDWTARSQLPAEEKAALEHFILTSSDKIQRSYDIKTRSDGHLESITSNAILLKGRKA